MCRNSALQDKAENTATGRVYNVFIRVTTWFGFRSHSPLPSLVILLILGDVVFLAIRKGFLRLPPSVSIPVICIGPGTGVAPMRSLIQKRIHDGAAGRHIL